MNKQNLILIVISLFIVSSCQVYKSVGRKDFESDAPSKVVSKPIPSAPDQANCLIIKTVNDLEPVNTTTSQLIEKSETREVWKTSENKIVTIQTIQTNTESSEQNLFQVCTQ